MPAFWWMMIPFMLAVGANIGVYSMLPLFLQAGRGLEQAKTNLLLSASRVAAMASPLLSGLAADRHGPLRVAGTTLVMVSLVMPLSIVVGGGLIPTFIGVPADAGRFDTAFALVGLFITAGAVFLWRIGARGDHR